ncbi:hypothetical protein N6L24_07905 [Cognatishimia sp. SS12]|uniref:hypothetical protein n=1 Tax=Cognatishimia sp. SS12 TaxID=2979465 RepID=UPI002330377E|nr:hypothetical protein [Cognatishimia sp. SS12]MDC0738200.1 hypothetical protein [Cognatishimia sp. SS12]
MSAAEFDAYTQGKTMTYATNGGPYGAEQYLPNRRVLWSFIDGECKEGTWYADNADICFVYEDNPTPQCWQFFVGSTGLSARFTGEGGSPLLYEVEQTTSKLECLGPKIGA